MTAQEKKQERMIRLIDEWKVSGQTKKEFCREQGIAYCVFHYWYKRYGQDQGVNSREPFRAITIPGGHPSAAALEMTLPDGRVLSFFHPIDVNLVKSLMM